MVYHRSWKLPTISRRHSEALFTTLGSPVGGGGLAHAFRRALQCWAQGAYGVGGNIASKLLQNSSKMEPTWLPNEPWRPLRGLLEVSWSSEKGLVGQGWLLDRLSGPKKSAGDRLLGAPWLAPRQVSAISGAQRLPKWIPREIPNRAQNVTPLQNS